MNKVVAQPQSAKALLAQIARDAAWAALKIRWALRSAALLGADEMRDIARRM